MERIGSNIAFIPLRAGSKAIPGKNFKLLMTKPLFCHAVEACLASEVFQRVVIATDSEEIKAITNQRYANVESVMVYDRSAENAQDHSSSESVMLEFANQFDFDHITLVQATSPLTSSADFRQALGLYVDQAFDSLLTVVREKRFYWNEDENTAVVTSENYDPQSRPRRQDFDGKLVENGAFYITTREALQRTKCRLSGKIGAYVMSPETAVEIDEPEDFLIIEHLMQKSLVQKPVIANDIKLVLSDVDGVLTDAGMYYSETGDELKKFNTRDGKGFELLRNVGLKVGIVTGEDTQIVERRAKKMKLDFLYQGINNKVAVVAQLIEELGMGFHQVAYIGDDINDTELLKKVGMSFCPSDAVEQNKAIVDVICNTKGGSGCFREMAEYLLTYIEKEA